MAKLNKVSTVKLNDTENNTSVSYATTTEPKKSTWGNSYFGTINSRGISKLQQTTHKETLMTGLAAMYNAVKEGILPTVHNEQEWCGLLKQTFGLTDDEIGDRGAKWDTPEARATLKVYVDEVEFVPEFSKAQLARHEKEAVLFAVPKATVSQSPTTSAIPMPVEPVFVIEAPKPPVASVPLPPIQAVADTVQVSIPLPPAPVVEAPVLTKMDAAYVNLIKGYIKSGEATKEQIIASLSKREGVEQANRLYGLAE